MTGEITRNVAEAALRTGEIAVNIAGVADATRQTSAGALDTQVASTDLAQMAVVLRDLVERFTY